LSALTGGILVVEDDPSFQQVLTRLFAAEGFVVEKRSDGRAGLDSFQVDAPSAAILDLSLPKQLGQRLPKEMKAAAPSIRIVIPTASRDLNAKVILLEMGADGDITKPFSPRELLARLSIALLHSNRLAMSQVTFDGIAVNFEKMEVKRNGAEVALTAREFKTLQFFIENPDRIITRSELWNKVGGHEKGGTPSRSIDNQILKLRQKLENDPSHPIHFQTAHRLGYKFAF
jgi:DNA-binding response OmpR family regulator